MKQGFKSDWNDPLDQSGQFARESNAEAVRHLELALSALDSRTKEHKV